MAIGEKAYELIKTIIEKKTPLVRVSRLLRYMSCALIIATYICVYYWDFLKYIDAPCAPLLPAILRNLFIIRKGIVVLIAYIVITYLLEDLFFNMFVIKLVVKNNDSQAMKWFFFITKIIDFAFTAYFLMFGINMLIDYANGIDPIGCWPLYLAIAYIGWCFIKKQYYIHSAEWNRNHIEYTDLCDKNGKRIAYDSFVSCRGIRYRVLSVAGKEKAFGDDNMLVDLKELIKTGEVIVEEK